MPTPCADTIRIKPAASKAGISLQTGRSWSITVEGRHLHGARWSRREARCGEEVELRAEVGGVPDGSAVQFRILEQDAGGADDFVAALDATVQGGTARAVWKYVHTDDSDEEGDGGPYTCPEYYFTCTLGEASARSALLTFKDRVEIDARDAYGRPLAHAPFVLHIPGGTRRGVLDAEGRATVEDVPPGRYRLELRGEKLRLPPLP